MINRITITTIICDFCGDIICTFDRGRVRDQIADHDGITAVVDGSVCHYCSMGCKTHDKGEYTAREVRFLVGSKKNNNSNAVSSKSEF